MYSSSTSNALKQSRRGARSQGPSGRPRPRRGVRALSRQTEARLPQGRRARGAQGFKVTRHQGVTRREQRGVPVTAWKPPG